MIHNKLFLAEKSLWGTSVGDAFGESFFGEENRMKNYIHQKMIPEITLDFTDDTIMSVAVFKSLEQWGKIDQDYLGEEFTKNYYQDMNRGYGPSMHQYFRALKNGESWKDVSYSKFEGQGSMGNGGAMRASVIGAFFHDDLENLKKNAELSCEVTHANKEAIEGTKAIALAAAFAVQEVSETIQFGHQEYIEKIQSELEDSDLKSKLNKALYLDGNPSIELLVRTLGNGIKMTAQDTVPLVIWMLSRYRKDFEKCLWNTVAALGDRDTTCAMAGGVSILCCDENTVPDWTKNVENWKKVHYMKIEIIKGDITKIHADAIVNAANSSLLGGGGVDGAIHRAGGPQILEECRAIRNRQGKCNTGEAVVTTAGNLPAQYVIHTVGPVWNGNEEKSSKFLSDCYKNSLKLAENLEVKTIAFPNISTGIYKFPKELAGEIAVHEVRKFQSDIIEEVIFVCFDEENEKIYKQLLKFPL